MSKVPKGNRIFWLLFYIFEFRNKEVMRHYKVRQKFLFHNSFFWFSNTDRNVNSDKILRRYWSLAHYLLLDPFILNIGWRQWFNHCLHKYYFKWHHSLIINTTFKNYHINVQKLPYQCLLLLNENFAFATKF